MAAPRKKLSKDDLKRFMKEKQSFCKNTNKKVNHPLAKYNSLNQLVCILCNSVIKNDLLWSAHILSKQHKEKSLALRTQGPTQPEHITEKTAKRKTDLEPLNDSKKQILDKPVNKSSLPSDFFDNKNNAQDQERRDRAKAALLQGYSSSEESNDDEDSERTEVPVNNKNATLSKSVPKDLPADFFDEGQGPSETDETDATKNKTMAEILPEGFFDDPKQDAKIRQVEYKDKMEEEWEMFQKAMKEEAHVSEVIIEEEDEQVNIERNIDEIDDQINRWQEVENLHVKKEKIIEKGCEGEDDKDEDSDVELDADELNELLDWRAKKTAT